MLPNGKTNLIAHDLGAAGDPIEALERVLELVRSDMVPHIVSRELIALSAARRGPATSERPVLGMFLGGAGLADTILYCRHKIYPLGLPNWLAHGLTFMHGHGLGDRRPQLAAAAGQMGAAQGQRHQERRDAGQVRLRDGDDAGAAAAQRQRRAVAGQRPGAMQLMVIERNLLSDPRRPVRGVARPARPAGGIRGVHLERGDEIRIEGHQSNVILDGEMFEADDERPIVLRPTAPVPFLRLAA